MPLVDIKSIQQQAKKEIADETAKAAVEKLKALYRNREKAALVVKNLDREIEGYLSEVSESEIYQNAGVNDKNNNA